MKAKGGQDIFLAYTYESEAIRKLGPSWQTTRDILAKTDEYLSNHPSVPKVYILITGWWEDIEVIDTEDLTSDQLDEIQFCTEQPPGSSGVGVITSLRRFRNKDIKQKT